MLRAQTKKMRAEDTTWELIWKTVPSWVLVLTMVRRGWEPMFPFIWGSKEFLGPRDAQKQTGTLLASGNADFCVSQATSSTKEQRGQCVTCRTQNFATTATGRCVWPKALWFKLIKHEEPGRQGGWVSRTLFKGELEIGADLTTFQSSACDFTECSWQEPRILET